MGWTELLLLATGLPGFLIGAAVTRDPWMGLPPAMLIIFAFLGFVGGSVAGETRSRTWEGAGLGLLLGPLGWLIVRLRPSRDREP
ncbi:MAG: hypothetical protein AAF560_30910 [Acidobacteriota bacterium]